jgi:hypothetical protein
MHHACMDKASSTCIVCPSKSGPLLLTDDGTSFIHVLCASQIPELYINDLNRVCNIKGIDKARYKLVCEVCNVSGTHPCIQCRKASCAVAFHPSCAKAKGFKEDHDEKKDGSVVSVVYCSKHSNSDTAVSGSGSGKGGDAKAKVVKSKGKNSGAGKEKEKEKASSETTDDKNVVVKKRGRPVGSTNKEKGEGKKREAPNKENSNKVNKLNGKGGSDKKEGGGKREGEEGAGALGAPSVILSCLPGDEAITKTSQGDGKDGLSLAAPLTPSDPLAAYDRVYTEKEFWDLYVSSYFDEGQGEGNVLQSFMAQASSGNIYIHRLD